MPSAGAGTVVDLVLDRTPFYAEGGGQLADAGTIRVTGGEFAVRDVQTPLPGLIVHRGQVSSGEITVGPPAFAEIDVERRPGTVQVAHCDAPGAPGAAQCAGRLGGAGGLGDLPAGCALTSPRRPPCRSRCCAHRG